MSKSIIQKSNEYCYLCALLDGNDWPQQTEEHHIFFGTGNRKLSEHYGLKVYLCLGHHQYGKDAVHRNAEMADILHKIGQEYFEKKYPDKDFRMIFGKNYR